MNNPKNQKSISRHVKLEDYKVFDYEIPEIFLNFVIKKKAVNVTTKLKLVKKNNNTRNLILDGTDILITKIFIDDLLLEEEYYKQQKNNLKIKNINKDGSPDIDNPSLYELLPSGEIKTHFCETENNRSNV